MMEALRIKMRMLLSRTGERKIRLSGDQSGMALVITLLALVLITALVVEFSYGVYTSTNALYNWRDSQIFSSNQMIRKIPIKTLLIAGLLMSGLIPTLVISFVSYSTTRKEMKDQVFRQLESVRNIKKEQIINFFNDPDKKDPLEFLYIKKGCISSRSNLSNYLKRLVDKPYELLEKKTRNGVGVYRLTEKGKHVFAKYVLLNLIKHAPDKSLAEHFLEISKPIVEHIYFPFLEKGMKLRK